MHLMVPHQGELRARHAHSRRLPISNAMVLFTRVSFSTIMVTFFFVIFENIRFASSQLTMNTVVNESPDVLKEKRKKRDS